MMFGLTKPDETITVKPFEVFQKEFVLTSSYINPYTQRRALELIDSGSSTYPRWSPRWLPSTNSAPSCQTRPCVPWVNI